ncbi:MAG: hypothetical protein K6T66_13445 [Peptococcaceae bacterium]|nr:hypothetical protein [Peptococcaceae bacterium]
MSQNKKTFKDYFRHLIDERLNHIFSGVINKDPVYQGYSERVFELYDIIARLLGPENEEIINEYDNASVSCTEIHQDTAYIIGFKDGMQLQRMLDEVS